MGLGEFKKAFDMYHGVSKAESEHKHYIDYQLGYYYLNTGAFKKAFDLWFSLRSSPFEGKGLKSIGRYWEKLGFLGDIKLLSLQSAFLEGFSAFVDEREKALTLKDLNLFVVKQSSGTMLALLIEKNPVFIKNSCGFVKWYETRFELPNQLVFPYLQRCTDPNKELQQKKIIISKAQAITRDEKLFLVSLYQKAEMKNESCQMAHTEVLASEQSFIPTVMAMCEENSTEIQHAIKIVLHNKLKEYQQHLKSGRIIRSAGALDVKDQSLLMNLVGEEAFAQEFIDNQVIFNGLTKVFKLSDETFLKYALFHKKNADVMNMVFGQLQTKEARELYTYLKSGSPYCGPVCSLSGNFEKKIALESKMISQKIDAKDLSCAAELIGADKGLSLLATELIIQQSEVVKTDETAKLSVELLKTGPERLIPSIEQIKSLSPDWGKDVGAYLNVQGHRLGRTNSSESLLRELRKLKHLRTSLSSRTWVSQKIADRSLKDFNSILSNFLILNQNLLIKLNLTEQFNRFADEMRFL
jgi:hypothetical protein